MVYHDIMVMFGSRCMHHIQGVKNEFADYITRNNFDDMNGARSEELAKEAFSRMDSESRSWLR